MDLNIGIKPHTQRPLFNYGLDDMALIETWDAAGTETGKIFTPPAAGFKHLKIVGALRSQKPAVTVEDFVFRFNNDATAGAYESRYEQLNGTTQITDWGTGTFFTSVVPAATATPTGELGHFECEIFDYLSGRPKFVRWMANYRTGTTNAGSFVSRKEGRWLNNAPITSINLYSLAGALFTDTSELQLYAGA